MTGAFRWDIFNLKRVAKFQEDPQTKLVDGDVVAFDDSLIAHNHAKKMPFIYRLWDHCNETYMEAMNLVVLYARKASGLQYPLLYSIWKQDNGKDPHATRLDLALMMLKQLRNQFAEHVKLWACFDSGYYGIAFYMSVEKLGFHWVTRAKSNTTLYRKVTIRGKERMIAITPETQRSPTCIFVLAKKGQLVHVF